LGRLKVFSGKEICKLLGHYGFMNVRQHGSHIVMQKKMLNTTITVIVPNHSTIRTGTLQSVIRQSKLSREIFEL
jgi:predicted RNA binding protein YcfA (HicA-like mRNA interferase family)